MTFSIVAKKREAGRAEELRAQGLIPAVLYGPEVKSEPVVVERNVFLKLYEEAGSNLVDLQVEGGETHSVLVQDIQIDPITREISHVDFRQVPMGKEFHTTIDLNFIGEAPAVKVGGTLNKGLESLNVKCLPKDLVGEINVDLSKLVGFNDMIKISDLDLPQGIIVTDDPNGVVATVSAPLTEEQIKAMEEEGPKSVEDVKVEVKKKETEEGDASEAK